MGYEEDYNAWKQCVAANPDNQTVCGVKPVKPDNSASEPARNTFIDSLNNQSFTPQETAVESASPTGNVPVSGAGGTETVNDATQADQFSGEHGLGETQGIAATWNASWVALYQTYEAEAAAYKTCADAYWAQYVPPTKAAKDLALAGYNRDSRTAPQAEFVDMADAALIDRTQLADTTQANAAQLGGVANMTATQIEQQKQAEFRQRQMDLVDRLELQASGGGPSVAGSQFKAATDRNLAQQQALAASARGGDIGLARRGAAQNVSDFNQQAAQAATIGKQQEQAQARAALGELITSGRQADIGLAQSQATLDQQAAQTNTEATNAFTIKQGDFEQQVNLTNAQADNIRKLQQGEMDQATKAANQAALNARTNLKAQLDQGVSLANIEAQLKQMGLDDAWAISHLQALTNLSIAELKAQLSRESIAAGLPPDPTAWDYVLGAASIIGPLVAMSDENLKKKKKKKPKGSVVDWLKEDDEDEEDNYKKYVDLASKTAAKLGSKRNHKKNTAIDAMHAAGSTVSAIASIRDAKKKKQKLKDKKKFANDLLDLESASDEVESSNWYEKNQKKLKDSQAGLLAVSDKNEKKDIKHSDKKLDDFLSKIVPYEYEYKDPKHGEGKRISPMAQDLEKSELGKEMVLELPDGKAVDYAKGYGTIVAAIAHLDSKIKELESKKKKGKK